MIHAATFDLEKFASILKDEVEEIAKRRYGGISTSQLGKAFQFWCIKNISLQPSEEDVELARSICEPGGSGDKNIDGAWIDDKTNTLFLMQAKYSELDIPDEEGTEFRQTNFDESAAVELEEGLLQLRKYIENKSQRVVSSRKLIELARLYEKAVQGKRNVELIVCICGNPKKSLINKVEDINDCFKRMIPNHKCSIKDLDALNQFVSDNLAPSPDIVQLRVVDSFKLMNDDNSIYAIACTVDASELIRVREQCGYRIYHSNFRFLLTRGGVARPKIERTLSDPSEKRNFWRYNNGVTVTCETVTPNESEPNTFEIKGFQVVNGLQTIEALYENKSLIEGVRVLIRIIPTKDPDVTDMKFQKLLEEHIAEYSNSQTPIRPRDLRSNDPVQREIERTLDQVYSLKYIRKVGEIPGLRGRPSRQRIDNEEVAQAALSFWHGMAHEAKNKKRLIFEKKDSATPGFYEKIFKDKTTAEYILLPYLLYDDEYKFIQKIQDNEYKGTCRNLDLLALSVVGDVFKSSFRIAQNPARAKRTKDRLRSAIKILLNGRELKTKKLWELVFKVLTNVAEKRRRADAKRKSLKPDQIQLRNVIVKMHYTEKKLKSEIMKKSEIRRVKKIMEHVFSG